MTATTSIEWADSTFNPWRGCTPVGPGCDHCYAAALSKRTGGPAYISGAPRLRTSDANWKLPVSWNRRGFAHCGSCGWRGDWPRRIDDRRLLAVSPACPSCAQVFGGSTGLIAARRRVFCASLADVFDNEVDPVWRADLFELVASTPNLDWLLLTKRIGNARTMINVALDMLSAGPVRFNPWPWPNVWLGATVVNQAEADRDVPKLLSTPAAVRFLSIEPMLGAIDLTELQPGGMLRVWCDALRGRAASMAGSGPVHDTARLDWVIAGGESGTRARPAHPDWFRSVRDQCKAAAVPFLWKQWGEWKPLAQMTHSGRYASAGNLLSDDTYVRIDGSTHTTLRDDHERFDASDALVRRVGKKSAGRTLDGVEHNGFPRSTA